MIIETQIYSLSFICHFNCVVETEKGAALAFFETALVESFFETALMESFLETTLVESFFKTSANRKFLWDTFCGKAWGQRCQIALESYN